MVILGVKTIAQMGTGNTFLENDSPSAIWAVGGSSSEHLGDSQNPGPLSDTDFITCGLNMEDAGHHVDSTRLRTTLVTSKTHHGHMRLCGAS